jgi:histidine triad (HIT) family protein
LFHDEGGCSNETSVDVALSFEFFITKACEQHFMSEDNCIFCKIVRGELPSTVIFEDEHCMAFMDIYPIRAGHALLIPKKHFVNLMDVDGDVVAHLARRLTGLVRGVKKATGAEGVLAVAANGEGAGQEVPHLHFHTIPRDPGDEFRFVFPTGYRASMADKDELKKMAERIGSSI